MSNAHSTENKDKYYVIGYPVKHSLSPKIHTEFANKTKQNMQYEAMEICPDNLEATLNLLRLDPEIKGLSVTLPFKEKLYQYCDKLEPLAQNAKAVSNVIINDKREFIGLNLDGLGLVNDIKENLGTSFEGKSILIIGAGGAAKGILGAIVNEKPKHITIANRTFSRALSLINEIEDKDITIAASELDSIYGSFDIIINATSASVNGENLPVTSSHFTQGALGYDLMYAPDGTVFTKWCDQHKIRSSDGTGMLMELSKIAFTRWRGITPQ
ncbi:shikimate dehydrogenase [Fangia hongkongensis]|uniref:shikimate dehydrogenase n=1 Tax=Fangia hongkongensis TaxID=270495 RepID=UPI000380C7F2|nr:shikimate dehydrogenase [Fangia hongkongensis]MBK2125030.1 shikimate dehydrogenase [Fangia hongkongensis]